ncbi:MAG: helix-turn-helix domain-containing protein [Ruminococcus bromii]|nr:helix-turn-helix domain-containing protein [Ruminococcus bromii]
MQGRPRCKPATYNLYTEYEKVPVLMTIQQAANLLQMSDRTVLNLITSNKIEAIRVGNQWRIPKDKLLNMEVSA